MRRALPFWIPALALLAGWGLPELLGLRHTVGVLSGTGTGAGILTLMALGYVLVWFGAVLVAPVLLLAGLLRLLGGRPRGIIDRR